MQFNYNKLRGRIKEKFGTLDLFSEELRMSRTSLSLRLNGKIEFSQSEIMNACKLLQLDPEEIPMYFFTIAV